MPSLSSFKPRPHGDGLPLVLSKSVSETQIAASADSAAQVKTVQTGMAHTLPVKGPLLPSFPSTEFLHQLRGPAVTAGNTVTR